MFRIKFGLIAQVILSLAFGCCVSPAQTLVAHRGVFHDANSKEYSYAENSYPAAINAVELGIYSIEFDLRLSSDGYLMVTHDQITNRTTRLDNTSGGTMDPVKVYLGEQPALGAIYVNSRRMSELAGLRLKIYGNNDTLTYSANDNMAELGNMLDSLNQRGLFKGGNALKVFLDIQDPNVFEKAANLVKQKSYKRNIYLKFFVSRALFNNISYDGSDTCYVYMKQHGLNDSSLNIVPQINDGELDINENDDAGIKAFGTTLTISEYLDCWRDAHKNHRYDTAYMPIVSASVPEQNYEATNGATEALNWAKTNSRKTMSIVPNPDVGTYENGNCYVYTFQTASVAAGEFNYNARAAKNNFANRNNVDYIVKDVMADFSRATYYTDIDNFDRGLCGLL